MKKVIFNLIFLIQNDKKKKQEPENLYSRPSGQLPVSVLQHNNRLGQKNEKQENAKKKTK